MFRIPKIAFIIFSIGISFLVSSFLYSHYFNDSIKFDTVALKNDVDAVVTSVTTFHFELPHVTLFSQRIENPSPTPEEPSPVPEPTTINENTPSENPTSTPYPQPTNDIPILPTYSYQPTRIPTNPPPRPTIAPTQAPQPTKTPKPTKAPDIFPVEASLQRPGRTVDEMFEIAAQKACIPKAALRAIASIESGGFFNTVGTKYLILYNSYNWWNSTFIPESEEGRIRTCSGWAYDQNTGLIPSDSKNAGKKCKDGYNSGLAVMGVMSTSPREFDLYKNATAKALGISVSQVDRRVILDALILTGFAIQKEVHAGSCTNWSASEMVKGACSYYGSCGFKDGSYYCNTFCRNLKTYGGGDCSGAISRYQTSCWN